MTELQNTRFRLIIMQQTSCYSIDSSYLPKCSVRLVSGDATRRNLCIGRDKLEFFKLIAIKVNRRCLLYHIM